MAEFAPSQRRVVAAVVSSSAPHAACAKLAEQRKES
jgi:hypothetical protein